MTRNLHPLLLLLVLPLCGAAFAQSGSTPAASSPQVVTAPIVLEQLVVSGEQPGPGMWKVSNGDRVLWIVGTQSPVPQKMIWRSKEIGIVVSQAQEILTTPSVGISVKQIGWFTALTMLPSALQMRKNPDDAYLKDIVPPELHARWVVLRDKYIDPYTINDEEKNIEQWRPMFAALELYRKAITAAGMTSASPVWGAVNDAASKYKVKITELRLEPAIKEPRAALKELRNSRLADLDCFAKTIERIETDLAAMRVRANAWARGDVDALRKLPSVDQRAACEAAIRDASFMKTLGTQNLLEQMESMWVNAAENSLKKNAVTLAVLPIPQIVAADGYVAKLRSKGYVVQEPE